MARQRDGPTTLEHTVTRRRRSIGGHAFQVLPTPTSSPLATSPDARTYRDSRCRGRKHPSGTKELRHGWLPHVHQRPVAGIETRGALACRPFHKPDAGCTACPRCWRSRRTAISSSYLIEQTPTSGCICSSAPTTDARAISPALPSPAGAVVLARANAALSELVLRGSQVSG